MIKEDFMKAITLTLTLLIGMIGFAGFGFTTPDLVKNSTSQNLLDFSEKRTAIVGVNFEDNKYQKAAEAAAKKTDSELKNRFAALFEKADKAFDAKHINQHFLIPERTQINMLYDIDWNIEFKTQGQSYKLALLASCEVFSSVDNLTDTATIVLPEAIMNEVLNFENKIDRGSEVVIQFGYNGDLRTEFTGYIKDITVNDSSLKILCEDALFLFRNSVPDVELKPTSLQEIGQYVIDNIDSSYRIDCTYNINYEKFTIHQATGYNVLSKLQEETKANIFFDTASKTLHIHPPYIEKGGVVYYSMQKNIENSSLEYKNRLDADFEITVESTDIKGNVQKTTSGTTGGEKITLKVGSMDKASMQRVADAELLRRSAPRYEGTFDTWLIPMVKPTYSARVKDEEYPEKTAFYYVQTVVTSISESGGKRTVTPGIKLS